MDKVAKSAQSFTSIVVNLLCIIRLVNKWRVREACEQAQACRPLCGLSTNTTGALLESHSAYEVIQDSLEQLAY
jgi:hypothetical protein